MWDGKMNLKEDVKVIDWIKQAQYRIHMVAFVSMVIIRFYNDGIS
jgi:hypothetical protein